MAYLFPKKMDIEFKQNENYIISVVYGNWCNSYHALHFSTLHGYATTINLIVARL